MKTSIGKSESEKTLTLTLDGMTVGELEILCNALNERATEGSLHILSSIQDELENNHPTINSQITLIAWCRGLDDS